MNEVQLGLSQVHLGVDDVQHAWVFLATTPLANLTLTLFAYIVAEYLSEKTGRHPLANPVLIAIALIVTVLLLTHTNYHTYFAGAQFVHFLLGPATVALAIPLYHAYNHIRSAVVSIAISMVSGSLFAAASSVIIAKLCGADGALMLSLAPKSATTPVAISISGTIGGSTSLTAIFVVLTGVLGAMFSTGVLNMVRVTDFRARGLATGLTAHGLGTAHKMRINKMAGAFAGLAMGLNALATAILVPLVIPYMIQWMA
ncbi:MAG: LrgB family protein [Rhizomicrobium sp.]